LAAGTAAAVVDEVSLPVGAVVSVAAVRTRAEWPVDGVVVVAVVVVAVAVSVAVVSVATAAVAGALLAAAAGDLRELVFSPDEVAALARAEWAVAFFAVVESLAVEEAELLSELPADALPAPDPAPVSA
jgi:hypothetical protein